MAGKRKGGVVHRKIGKYVVDHMTVLVAMS